MSNRAESFPVGLIGACRLGFNARSWTCSTSSPATGTPQESNPSTRRRSSSSRWPMRPICPRTCCPGAGTLSKVAETGGFNFAEVTAADTGGLESLRGQLGIAFNGRHRTKNVQLWTMGHARVIIDEESTEDPQAAGAPGISAPGFDVGSPVIDHVNQAQPSPAEPQVLTVLRTTQHQHPTKGGCCA